MFIPKKNHVEVYKNLFRKGVLYAKKEYSAPKHPEIDVLNLQTKNAVFSTKATSLSLGENSRLRVVDPPPEGIYGIALKLLGYYSRESQLIRGSRTLYLRMSFRTTHAMLLLHMWLTLVRLRVEGKDGARVGQIIYELFNHDLEKRIVEAGVKMLISKWMKELEKKFYGAVQAYDEAMKPSTPKDDLARAL